MTAPILNNLGMGGGARRVLLKNGSVALDTNGDVILIPAGKDPEECPCCDNCADGVACIQCDDNGGIAPDQFEVTFSTVSLCGCINVGGSGVDVTLNTALNGKHTLSQGGCSWSKTVTNGAQIDTWNTDPVCGGSSDTSVAVNYVITLTRRATDWELNVSTTGSGTQYDIFSDTQVADTDGGGNQLCQEFTGKFTNDHAVGNCGSTGGLFGLRIVGYDGTATIACL